MTSPPIRVEVTCPDCGTTFTDYYRPSINLSLDPDWTEEALDVGPDNVVHLGEPCEGWLSAE
jgi:hypothetical protein